MIFSKTIKQVDVKPSERIWWVAVLLIFANLDSFSQIDFENGYLIYWNGERIDCLIKNSDWKNNPETLEYKLSNDEISQKANISSVKEFGVGVSLKYVAADVKIDRTLDNISGLTHEKNPVWKEERLFLKVLVEGKISLLFYEDSNLRRFFYDNGDTAVQLIYKKYLDEGENSRTNFSFRQQISSYMKCGNVTDQELMRLDYVRKDLMTYFKKYNACAGSEVVEYSKAARSGFFHLKITPGVNYSSFAASYQEVYFNDQYVDFGAQMQMRIGCELEWVLPYNRNKWSIVLDPNFQSYEKTGVVAKSDRAKYKTFEIPLGVRYYFLLGENSRIFINGFVAPTFCGKASSLEIGSGRYEFSPPPAFAMGVGFAIKKFSGEIRYYENGDILNEYLHWTGDYAKTSFILGFRLF
jgi:hypothetical protein